MRFTQKFAVSAVVFFAFFFLIIAFHSVPESRLWKGYSVLYVDAASVSKVSVPEILNKHGIKDVISLDEQKIPVISKIAPVQAQSKDSYIIKREGFFRDFSSSYSIFYVPEKYSSSLKKAVEEINSFSAAHAGTDGNASFTWICPLVSLIFGGILVYFSKKRKFCVPAFIPAVVLVFSRPFFTVSAAACLFMTGIFLAQKIWKRKNFFEISFNSVFILIFMLVPFMALFLSSASNALLYLCSVIASFSAVILTEEFSEMYFRSKTKFSFVYIKNASGKTVVNKSSFKIFCILSGACLFLLVFSVITGNFRNFSSFGSVESKNSSIQLPSPVNRANAVLPSVEDFFDWSWETVSFPFRKLDSSSDKEIQKDVFVKDYVYDENGSIVERETKILSYDTSFINSICDTVKNADYPAVEQLMLEQGRNASFGYSKNAGTVSERFLVVLLLFFAAVPVCLYFVYGVSKDFSF